jgi:hypothetical protein
LQYNFLLKIFPVAAVPAIDETDLVDDTLVFGYQFKEVPLGPFMFH